MTTTKGEWSKFSSHIVRTSSRSSDERYTPQWVLDLAVEILGGIDLDPCADPRKRVPATSHFTPEMDGLEQAWSGRVFLNPPFSDTGAWLNHLCTYSLSGSVTEAVALLPVMVLSNQSARLLMREVASAFVILERGLEFLNADYDSMGRLGLFPCSLVYVGENYNNFLNLAGKYGVPSVIHKPHKTKITIQCRYCSKLFTAKRSTAKFCSTACRVESHRKLKKSA